MENKEYQTSIYNNFLDDTEFISHDLGEFGFDKFILWEQEGYPSITFFISNISEGFVNLTRLLSKTAECINLDIALSKKQKKDTKYYYRKNVKGSTVRMLQLLKNSKWKFAQIGEPLPYEDLEMYKNKLKRKRLTTLIIYD